jgi:hypothetical protein
MSKIKGFITAEENMAWNTCREALLKAERVIQVLSRDKQADDGDKEQATRSLRFIRDLLGKV